MGAEPAWAQPRAGGHCQEQLPRIPAQLIPGMELLRLTLDDCASLQRFFNTFLKSYPGSGFGFLVGHGLCGLSGTFGHTSSPAEVTSSQ